MDVRVQELCVCYTDTDRGRRHRKLVLISDECHLLTTFAAFPLLYGMAIQTCHGFASLTLVRRWW